jgi:transketolase
MPLRVAALRATPGMLVLRPADGNETSGAYKARSRRVRGPLLSGVPRG